MRCNNCGWPNNPTGSQRCEKCNAPLNGSIGNDNTSGADQPMPPVNQPLNGTIFTPPSGQPYVDAPSEASTGKPNTSGSPTACKCGYPLTAGSTMCPNCHQPVIPSTADSGSSMPPQQPAPGRRGTIDPFANGGGLFDSCKLIPIVQPGEVKSVPLTFSGSTILNRANVDPSNMTTTSREQVELICTNG